MARAATERTLTVGAWLEFFSGALRTAKLCAAHALQGDHWEVLPPPPGCAQKSQSSSWVASAVPMT